MNLFRRQPINDRPKGRSLCWVPLPESVHADTHDAIHITSHTFGLTARFEFLEFESMLGGPGVTRYMNPGYQNSVCVWGCQLELCSAEHTPNTHTSGTRAGRTGTLRLPQYTTYEIYPRFRKVVAVGMSAFMSTCVTGVVTDMSDMCRI